MKLPAIQFYVGDWLRDPISGCSLAAQGLWLRIMFVMHDGEEYGRLSVAGKPMSTTVLARRCGCPIGEFIPAWNELLDNGVPTVDEDGFIYSRRMVRDASTRQNTRERVAKHRLANHAPTGSKVVKTQSKAKPPKPEKPKPAKSVEDVEAYASELKVEPKEAHDFFHHYESQGWFKSNGMPVLRWKSAFQNWLKRDFGSKKNVTNGKPVSVWALREQEREIESAIETARDNRSKARSEQESKKILEEIRELKEKHKSIKTRIVNA